MKNEILNKILAKYYESKRMFCKTNKDFDYGVIVGIEKAIKIIQESEKK